MQWGTASLKALVTLLPILALASGWQIRARSRLSPVFVGLALASSPPLIALSNEAAQEVVAKAVTNEPVPEIVVKVVNPLIETKAPSWLKTFQATLEEEAERHLKEREEIERLRTAFETDLDDKRRAFEVSLEFERKQFEIDIKKEAEIRDQAEKREGNLKYYVSLGVTLTLFALDQSLKSRGKEDERIRPTKRGKGSRDDSLLD